MVKAQHLVIDSGGFLRNADIQSMGCQIYTIQDVVAEIRDKATRQRLSFIPYKIQYKTASQESLEKVIQVAKKSGDYASLSSTDLKVIALTYDLTSDNDPESLHELGKNEGENFQFGNSSINQDHLPGFYLPKSGVGEVDELPKIVKLTVTDDCDDKPNDITEECDDNADETKENEMNHQSSEDAEEEDADEGWITPKNIRNKPTVEQPDDITVGCVTTDFAMQNVLMKMGLKILSVDGMIIRTIRTYVLRCHACFFITKIMNKQFCPKCGNNTLKRVPMETQPDGKIKYFLSKNPKILNKRGKKSSLPMPKGGKHAFNPVLCEDQPIPQNRLSKKAQRKTDVWGDDYAIDGNPFAVRDTDSRAFKLGIQCGRNGPRSKNPNAVNRKFVKQH